MKNLICFLILVVVSVESVEKDDIRKKWQEYQVQYGKSYKSPVETQRRLSIFEDNLKKIEEHNVLYEQGKSGHMEGVNQFTDWTDQEFLSYIKRETMYGVKIWGAKFVGKENFEAPTSVDWRNRSAVTGVKDQGMCGSSWSFSAVGAIEGQLGRKGNLFSLSEQNLIDCLPGSGCTGGSIYQAFDFVKDNGIESAVSYPYIAVEGSCFSDPSKTITTITNFVKIPANDEDALREAIATAGPIAVAIDATENLKSYKGGILEDSVCRNDAQNHAALVVGYGRENQTDYYILKNSWGETWGENGYFRLPRNKNNSCGVASMASYPVL